MRNEQFNDTSNLQAVQRYSLEYLIGKKLTTNLDTEKTEKNGSTSYVQSRKVENSQLKFEKKNCSIENKYSFWEIIML